MSKKFRQAFRDTLGLMGCCGLAAQTSPRSMTTMLAHGVGTPGTGGAHGRRSVGGAVGRGDPFQQTRLMHQRERPSRESISKHSFDTLGGSAGTGLKLSSPPPNMEVDSNHVTLNVTNCSSPPPTSTLPSIAAGTTPPITPQAPRPPPQPPIMQVEPATGSSCGSSTTAVTTRHESRDDSVKSPV